MSTITVYSFTDENGDVLFQGSPAVGATSHTCRLQSWARGDA